MKLSRKVTDFIRLEDGNIGRKSAVVTGALLASTMLGAVLTSAVEATQCHSHDHYDHSAHTDTHEQHLAAFCP